MNDVLKQLQKDLGISVTTELKTVSKLSMKDKILNSCKREIKRLMENKSLEYPKNQSGVRFLKPSNEDENKTLVNVKYKGKIFGFGDEVNRQKPNYFKTDNNYESVVELITKLMGWIDKVDQTDKMFDLESK